MDILVYIINLVIGVSFQLHYQIQVELQQMFWK